MANFATQFMPRHVGSEIALQNLNKIHKAIKLIADNILDGREVVCAWHRADKFPGIWVLTKNFKAKFPAYDVYVCKLGIFTHKITTKIPVVGPLSKDHVTSLASGNEISWVSESILDF